MLRFRCRLALFLNTLVQLGGYCTVGQAKGFGIGNSDTRASAQLRTFEENGFLRRVASYPVVYQVTKSATRLSAADRRARRPHRPKTILSRLLAVDSQVLPTFLGILPAAWRYAPQRRNCSRRVPLSVLSQCSRRIRRSNPALNCFDGLLRAAGSMLRIALYRSVVRIRTEPSRSVSPARYLRRAFS